MRGDRRRPGVPLRAAAPLLTLLGAALLRLLGAALLLALVPASSPLAGGPLAAQQETAREDATAFGPLEASTPEADTLPDGVRRDTARARPPPRPPADLFDALSFPLRVALLPVTAVGAGVQGLVSLAYRGGGANPIGVAIGDMRTWGASPRALTIGPRSGPGLGLVLDRWEPFFARSEVSIRGSQRHGLGLRLAREEGAVAWAEAEFRRYAEPHFWGIGPHTDPEAEADFRWDRLALEGGGNLRTGPLAWRGELGYERNEVSRGSDDDAPDLQDVATGAPPFGLRDGTRFARGGVRVALDATSLRGYQPRGLRAELGGAAFLGVGDTDAEFLRWTAELVGYVPLNLRQQLALRGLLETNRPLGGRGVPFTHLASLGGSSTLRGFERDRFRDLDLLAIQGEWRYEIWRSIRADDLRQEGFVFFDAGSVADRVERLDGSPLRSGYGFGMRTVDGRGGVVLLWYLAFGGEETQFRVKLSWPF